MNDKMVASELKKIAKTLKADERSDKLLDEANELLKDTLKKLKSNERFEQIDRSKIEIFLSRQGVR